MGKNSHIGCALDVVVAAEYVQPRGLAGLDEEHPLARDRDHVGKEVGEQAAPAIDEVECACRHANQ